MIHRPRKRRAPAKWHRRLEGWPGLRICWRICPRGHLGYEWRQVILGLVEEIVGFMTIFLLRATAVPMSASPRALLNSPSGRDCHEKLPVPPFVFGLNPSLVFPEILHQRENLSATRDIAAPFFELISRCKSNNFYL